MRQTTIILRNLCALLVTLAWPQFAAPQAPAERDGEPSAATEHAHECAEKTSGTLTATPSEIRPGETVTLEWLVNRPENCHFGLFLDGQPVQRAGTRVSEVLATTEHRLAVSAPNHRKQLAQATVTVRLCPVVDIKGSSKEWARLLVQAVGTEGTTVRLWPSVDMDLSGYESIRVRRGVTLTSERPADLEVAPTSAGAAALTNTLASASSNATAAALQECPPAPGLQPLVSGRRGLTLGPRLFTRTRPVPLFVMGCERPPLRPDNIRLFGFRLHGAHFGVSEGDEKRQRGIQIRSCVGVEIANMELAGWSGQAIYISDQAGRMLNPSAVRIHHNFIHHNQHEHSNGYGIDVKDDAYALIEHNTFDFNRHAIAAAGAPGTGYEARQNLVLKGGGEHRRIFVPYTHQFDVHGDSNCPNLQWIPLVPNWLNCGNAGEQFWFTDNTFQFTKARAIKLRGTPRLQAIIRGNVLAHHSMDEASKPSSSTSRVIVDANRTDDDTYGQYGVCDLDGDGRDDLFLATGKTWWYSSAGRVHWVHLRSATQRLTQLGLGYFDADRRCDVLTRDGDRWTISSGGFMEPQPLPGTFRIPFEELRFADFNADGRTDIFRRDADGSWSVISPGVHDWRPLASSPIPLEELRFGDFDGDDVTDVLSLAFGHWSYSRNGTEDWRPLNEGISTKLKSLLIGDVDGDGRDDIARFVSNGLVEGTWKISLAGRSRWQSLKKVTSPGSPEASLIPARQFIGHFDNTRGADLIYVDYTRIGRIYKTATDELVPYNLYAY